MHAFRASGQIHHCILPFRCYEFNDEPKMIFSGNSKIVYIFESALILPINLIIANE